MYENLSIEEIEALLMERQQAKDAIREEMVEMKRVLNLKITLRNAGVESQVVAILPSSAKARST